MNVPKKNQTDAHWLNRCTSAGHCVSMLFMVMIVTLISVEIFIRTVFQFSTFISEKPLVYFLTGVLLMGAAQILKDGSRIRRFPLFSMLGSTAGRRFRMAITAVAIAVCSSALYQSVVMLHRTYRVSLGADFSTGACLFLLQAVIPIGFLLFNLQLIFIFFKTFHIAQRA